VFFLLRMYVYTYRYLRYKLIKEERHLSHLSPGRDQLIFGLITVVLVRTHRLSSHLDFDRHNICM